MHDLLLKRIYEKPDIKDGYRILIDRLWPRGETKDEADIDYWAKSIAPTTEIRKAFNHLPENMVVFKKKYIEELNNNPETTEFLSIISENLKKGNVTLLLGAKDKVNNHGVVLQEWINNHIK